jgi:phospholipid/cholesterol/gamma-HCH transport system permease protein
VHLGALLLALALTPSSYALEHRRALARHVYLGSALALAWFTVLATLISVVVTRIVLVTAVSYGLSQYALETVVRVLVLELLPLSAALFAALRCSIPQAAELAAVRAEGGFEALQRAGVDPMRREVLPRVSAGVFCALLLATVSCVVTLIVAYLSVYGWTAAGLDAYTHTVGQVFKPSVSLILALKIVFFAGAVALIPVAAVLDDSQRRGRSAAAAELAGLVRMFLVLLLVEIVSLVGNYY